MRLGRIATAVLLLLGLAPLDAWADRHRAGAYFGWRSPKRSDLDSYGLGTNIKFCTGATTKQDLFDCEPFALSFVIEVSVGWGEHEDGDLTQGTGLLGPRLDLFEAFGRPGGWFGHDFGPFVELLYARHRDVFVRPEETRILTKDALAIGVGLDYRIHRNFGLRGHYSRMRLWNDDESDWFDQISLSVLYEIR